MVKLWLCFVQELLFGRVEEIGAVLQHAEALKKLEELGCSLVKINEKQISIWHIWRFKWRVLATSSHPFRETWSSLTRETAQIILELESGCGFRMECEKCYCYWNKY